MAGVEILEKLENLGIRVQVVGPDRLRFQPASKIPPELVARIRDAKPEILQALRRPAKAQTSKGPCRFDWVEGYRGIKLTCAVHRHPAGRATVFRRTWQGHDTLRDMLEEGFLIGQAFEDAQRVN